MYLDRDYKPKRRRRGLFERFWPLLLLIVVGIIFYETRPVWLAPRQILPTPTPTLSSVSVQVAAEAAMKTGDYARAMGAFREVTEVQPNNVDAWITLSRLEMIDQNIAAAKEAALQALALDPKNADALTALARAEDWLGDFEAALNHALDALEIDAENAETLAVLAEIYTDVGNYAIASDYIDQALALDPQNVLAHRSRAYLRERRTDYDGALEAIAEAIAIDPNRWDLYMERGRYYRVGKLDYPNAIAAYRQAVDVHSSPVTLDALGDTLFNSGDYLQAVRVLRDAVEMDPTYGPAVVHLGMALYYRRNYEDAVISLEKGINLIGDSVREEYFYTAGMAHVYKEPQDCAAAEPWLRKALELNPTSEPALNGLSICSAQQNRNAIP